MNPIDYDGLGDIRYVYSAEDSVYQYWQGTLLYESMRHFGNENHLTGMISCKEGQGIRCKLPGDAIRCHDYASYKLKNGYTYRYVPRNKPYQLQELLKTRNIQERFLVFLDPDFIQIQNFNPSIEDLKTGACGYAPYMKSNDKLTVPIMELLGLDVDENDWSPSIVPYIFEVSVWKEIAPLWCYYTDLIIERIHESRMYMYHDSWFIEMWSFCVALHKLGLKPKICTNELFCFYLDKAPAPFLHYCHPFINALSIGIHTDARTLQASPVWFDKRYYTPWKTILPAEVKNFTGIPSNMTFQSAVFLEMLNATARKYRSKFPSGLVSPETFDALNLSSHYAKLVRDTFGEDDFRNLFLDARLKNVEEVKNAGPPCMILTK